MQRLSESTNSLFIVLASHEHLKELQQPWGPPSHIIEVWFWFKVTGRVSFVGAWNLDFLLFSWGSLTPMCDELMEPSPCLATPRNSPSPLTQGSYT